MTNITEDMSVYLSMDFNTALWRALHGELYSDLWIKIYPDSEVEGLIKLI